MMLSLLTTATTLLQNQEPQPEKIAGADIYIVLSVTMIVWIGIFLYLLVLDRKLQGLQKEVAGDGAD